MANKGTLNKVLLVGHLGKDAKSGTTKSGLPYCSLAVATNRSKKSGDGWEDVTDWHSVMCYGDVATSAAKYGKGSLVFVEGRIQKNDSEEAFDPYFVVAGKVEAIGFKESGAATGGTPLSVEELPF
jgi:single stranded DNA-binding protein